MSDRELECEHRRFAVSGFTSAVLVVCAGALTYHRRMFRSPRGRSKARAFRLRFQARPWCAFAVLSGCASILNLDDPQLQGPTDAGDVAEVRDDADAKPDTAHDGSTDVRDAGATDATDKPDAAFEPERMTVGEHGAIQAIAVDRERLYWATERGVFSMSKTPLATRIDHYLPTADQIVRGFAADEGSAYWMDGAQIYAVSVDRPGERATLCDVTELGLLDGWASLGGEWLSVTAQYVIASRPFGNAVVRVSKAGGCEVIARPGAGLRGSVTDETSVYSALWSADAGSFLRYDFDGGNSSALVAPGHAPLAFGVFRQAPVWIEFPTLTQSTLWRSVQGQASLLGTLEGMVTELVIDDAHERALVVQRAQTVSDSDSVQSLELDGGAKSEVFPRGALTPSTVGVLAVDANCMYFGDRSSNGSIWRAPLL